MHKFLINCQNLLWNSAKILILTDFSTYYTYNIFLTDFLTYYSTCNSYFVIQRQDNSRKNMHDSQEAQYFLMLLVVFNISC